MLKAINHPFFSLFALLALFGFASCSSPKNTAYFQTIKRDTTLQNIVTKNFDLKIRPDDLLSISVASASTDLSGLFNAAQGSSAIPNGAATTGYLVDKNGVIQFYKLGNIGVAGLTRDSLRELLQRELAAYLKGPVVTVRFANHRITVLGEVGTPGVIPIPNDQMTILEAIGQSGDLKETAKPDNVLVIRQTDKGKEFRHVNLQDHSVFSSPYFYLQNDDVVYVEPDVKKKEPKVQQTVSYIISGVSLLTLLISRIR